MNKILLLLCLGCVLFSCRSRKVTVAKRPIPDTEKIENTEVGTNTDNAENVSTKAYANDTEKYIDTYKEIAQNEMNLYGIPASITLAQGILESGSGNGRLSVEANNHFGIKCHEWTGARIYHDDDAAQECFRKYIDAKYSFRDHSLFLTERNRYAKLFDLNKADYKRWAKELRAAGYATDRKYPEKLISLIERYELYKFDKEVLGESFKDMEMVTENEQFTYMVMKGDTLYSISKKYNMTVEELQRINGLNDTALSIGQELQLKPASKNN